AWRISNEDFFNNMGLINDLKLRASYGQTGSNNIGNYQHIADVNFTTYTLGGSIIPGYGPGRLANPNLTWETQDQLTLGFDLSLFNERLHLKVDHFQSVNKDLLLDVRIPATTG